MSAPSLIDRVKIAIEKSIKNCVLSTVLPIHKLSRKLKQTNKQIQNIINKLLLNRERNINTNIKRQNINT